MKIVVIIPTYNECTTIGALIDALQEVFRRITRHALSILVVDSNSPDSTAVLVKEKMRRYQNVHLLEQPEKRGLGSAYVLGMRYAIDAFSADAFIEFDADFQHNPNDVPRLIAEFENGYDYVIGSRYVPGGSVPKEWAFHRKLLSAWGNRFVCFMLNLPIHDATSGLKLTRVLPFAKRLPLEERLLHSRFIAYKIHLLYRMYECGARIKEIPIAFDNREKGDSKSSLRDIVESLKVVWRIRRGRRKIYYLANARMPTEKAHGIQIAKMSEALRAAGADLTLVVPRRGSVTSLKEFYNLADEVPLIRLPVIPYGWSFWLGSFSFMLSAFFYLLFKKITGERFLIYTIDMDQFSFAPLPFLCTSYFVEIHDAKRHGILFHLLFSRAQGVLTINHIIKKKLCERFGMPEQKVLVAPNGISDEFFRAGNISKEEARLALDLPRKKRIALYAGQFYAWKGLEIFADAARRAPDILWYLAGGTREVFEKITGIRNIPDNIVFGGIRPYREVPLLMAAADALIVLGTRRDEYSYYHTSPMKLFEYLPVGRPIVAAATPAIKDMVSEKEVFFYEPDSAESMAAAAQEAIQNTSAASDKTRAARTLAEKYTWQKRAELVLKYIKWL